MAKHEPLKWKKGTPLAVAFPEIAKEAYGWNPEEVSYGFSKPMPWKCELGHTWKVSPGSRTYYSSGCPICSAKVLLSGFNDLATTRPEIASEADGWDATKVVRGSRDRKQWKCTQGHKWEATINSRVSNKSGCPICSGNEVLKGFNDLASVKPEVAKDAYGWDPSEVTWGSGLRKKWICSEGHIYESIISHKTRTLEGCPFCDGKKVLAGFNDLATTHPHIANEAFGWDPKTVIAGSSSSKRQWKCSLGHFWEATANTRTNKSAAKNSGCPICANKQTLSGFNDLATTNPELAAQLVSPDPTTITESSHIVGIWKCKNNHEWSSRIANRRGGERGCPTCAKSGYDPNAKGWLYFLLHEEWDLLQIGITNEPDVRLNTHQKIGWEVIELRGPMPGDVAKSWERSIINLLKKKNAELGKPSIGLFGRVFTGHTESWRKGSFPVTSIQELMQMVEKEENLS